MSHMVWDFNHWKDCPCGVVEPVDRYFVLRDGKYEIPPENWEAFKAELANPNSKVWGGFGPHRCYRHREYYSTQDPCKYCQKEKQPMPTTPRQTVTVDGVLLTRQQVERAMQELERPVEPTALERVRRQKVGDRVRILNRSTDDGHPNRYTYVFTGIERARHVNIYSGYIESSYTNDVLARMIDDGRATLLPREEPS